MRYPLRPLVIIPTFNERANITQLVQAILDVDSRLHILIVDDNSPDNTGTAVLELKKKNYPTRLFLQSRPGKLGYSHIEFPITYYGAPGGKKQNVALDCSGSILARLEVQVGLAGIGWA